MYLLIIGGSPVVEKWYKQIDSNAILIGNHPGSIMKDQDWNQDLYWESMLATLESMGLSAFDCIMVDFGSESWLHQTNPESMGVVLSKLLKQDGFFLASDYLPEDINKQLAMNGIRRQKTFLSTGILKDNEQHVLLENTPVTISCRDEDERIKYKIDRIQGIIGDVNSNEWIQFKNSLQSYNPEALELGKIISKSFQEVYKSLVY